MTEPAFLTPADAPTLRKLETLATNIAATEPDPMKRAMFRFMADLCGVYVRAIEGSTP